jgi:hypothetical protein
MYFARSVVLVGRRLHSNAYVGAPTGVIRPGRHDILRARGFSHVQLALQSVGTQAGGYLSAVEGGVDLAALAGAVGVAGTLAALDSVADTAELLGQILVRGLLSAVDSSTADTAAILQSASVSAARGSYITSRGGVMDWRGPSAAALSAVVGTLAAIDADSDTAAIVGTGAWILLASEGFTDTAAVPGTVLVQGALDATDVDADVSEIFGDGTLLEVSGSIAATDAYTDTAHMTGSHARVGNVAAVELFSDTALLYQTRPNTRSPCSLTVHGRPHKPIGCSLKDTGP